MMQSRIRWKHFLSRVKGVYILVYTVGVSIVLQAQFRKLVVYLCYMRWRDLKNVGKVERRARWTSGQLGNHICMKQIMDIHLGVILVDVLPD